MRPDRIQISLAPARLEVARLQSSFRGPKLLDERAIEFDPASEGSSWAAALDRLAIALADGFASGCGEVGVVVSNHFVRYAVLPWNPDLVMSGELQIAAIQRFTQIFGPKAADWEICRSRSRYGEATVACALDRALLEQIDALSVRFRLRLVSVQPLLIRCFNALRERIAADGWLAVVERGRVCLVSFRAGAWQSIISRRCPPDDPAATIEQELSLIGMTATPGVATGRLDLVHFATDSRLPQVAGLEIRRHDVPGDRACMSALFGLANGFL